MNLLPNLQVSLGGFRPVAENYNLGSNTNDGALSNLEQFISTMIGVITVFAGMFFIVSFLMGAVSWISAGGDSGKIQSARDKMIQSTLGLVVVVAAYAVIGLIGRIVGLDVLNPAEMLSQIIPTAPVPTPPAP